MGKKGKKDKKGKGAEKTAQKTERNLEKKQKKLLKEKGEDDIEALIAEFQEKDRQKNEVAEEKCPPPSHRSNMSLTPHPDKDELIMFGGEYFNGQKTFLYNDMFFYNIKNNEWSQVKAPNAPPPRCSHQAVSLRQGGGQLWIFGGEFASPTQTQFYHYRDLWVYHIREKKWDKISAPGGPSARSGHRMVICKKMLIVFGGFHDNTRDYKYYNDLHAFNLETYTWMKLETSGNPPLPRSGHVMATTEDGKQIVIYGGYSKERVKKDVDKGRFHTDMFTLTPEGKSGESCPLKWRWQATKQTGVHPSQRCGCSLVTTPGNRAVVFGGVFDEEEDDENVKGKFYNDMYSLELDKGRWHEVELRGKQDGKERKRRRKQKEKTSGEGDVSSESGESDVDGDMEEEISKKLKMDENQPDIETIAAPSDSNNPGAPMSVSTDPEPMDGPSGVGQGDTSVPMESPEEESVFKVVVGGPSQKSTTVGANGDASSKSVDLFVPHPRMNPILAMKNGVLYLYGGLFEAGDKQLTLQDFYSLDLHKLDEWKTIIASDMSSQEWLDSDSSGDEGQAAGGEDSDDEMDIDAPALEPNETLEDYYTRTSEFWLQQAQEMAQEEGIALSEKQMKKAAKNMAKEAYEEEEQG